ncbi:MAG: hypothetical protein GY838_00945 [bacterium]|nr:hypothetical protein [bacterium]
MRYRHFLIALTLLAATTAPAGAITWPGEIVLGPDLSSNTLEAWTPGLYEIQLFVWNPTNEHTGDPIQNVGGFELNLSLTEEWFFQSIELPPGVIDFDAATDAFYCAGQIPVQTVTGSSPGWGYERYAHLATITVGTFVESPGYGGIYVAPYWRIPSIPGHMAITDADDEYSLSPVYPATGSYEWPVMGINAWVVPERDTSWSELKALYR